MFEFPVGMRSIVTRNARERQWPLPADSVGATMVGRQKVQAFVDSICGASTRDSQWRGVSNGRQKTPPGPLGRDACLDIRHGAVGTAVLRRFNGFWLVL